jgi:hypothetical protein
MDTFDKQQKALGSTKAVSWDLVTHGPSHPSAIKDLKTLSHEHLISES